MKQYKKSSEFFAALFILFAHLRMGKSTKAAVVPKTTEKLYFRKTSSSRYNNMCERLILVVFQ